MLIFGIVNATPDSFSGDGLAQRAAPFSLADWAGAGADVLDLGAESTRPGAEDVPAATEWDRLAPVLAALPPPEKRAFQVSIDTRKPAIFQKAAAFGAQIWNDVSALRGDPDSPAIAAAMGCDVVLMHMQGAPADMQTAPAYDDVVAEVIGFLQERCAIAESAGVRPDRLWVDPGVGFGKTLAHNLALLRALPRIRVETGKRVLVGASRKRFIAALDPAGADPADRLGGSLAAALWAALAGADAVRVHDVAPTRQALRVWRELAIAPKAS